jgi:divalent metal cation (Fe/Co/Zn/Cd) transporter
LSRTKSEDAVKKGISVEIASILWMLVEAGVAIVAGSAAHSLALVAFGIDSIIELIAGVVLLWRLLIELRGHDTARINRAEKSASWVVGGALLLLSAYIIVSALLNLFHHRGAEASKLGVILAIAAGLIMPYLAWAKIKIGKMIGSNALKSDGRCSLVCAYMSWILLIGVVSTALFGSWWIDGVLSLLLVYFIFREGIEALQSARDEEPLAKKIQL